MADWEHTLLSSAIAHLLRRQPDDRPAPTLGDLARLLHQPTEAMMAAVLADD